MFQPFDPNRNRYASIRGISRRARCLWAGVPDFGVSTSKNICRVAVDEWRAGKLEGMRLVQPDQPSALFLVPRPAAEVDDIGDESEAA